MAVAAIVVLDDIVSLPPNLPPELGCNDNRRASTPMGRPGEGNPAFRDTPPPIVNWPAAADEAEQQ
jgi:hypothetical protein